MITTKLQGGLGNQMFQIAVATSMAIDNNDKAVFDIDTHKIGLQGCNANKYKNNVFKKVECGVFYVENRYNEPNFCFNKIPHKQNMELNGYFQSEKYFEHNRDKILELFEPPKEIKDILNVLIKVDSQGKETVSLHIRRGDYLKFPHIHPVINLEYISNALKYFNNHTIFVISDDIEWCRNNIKCDNKNEFVFRVDTEDYEDLYLMSLCDHNIIANSSFSWWGSYLNKNENKTVIVPKEWFGKGFTNGSFQDIYRKEMIKI